MLKIAYDPIYVLPLPEGHRFPMLKYELIPKQLIYEGSCKDENFFTPEKAEKLDVLRVHTETYYNRLVGMQLDAKEVRKIGFPLTSALVEREQIIAQGTIECCYHALKNGIAMNIAGGTHHAYANHGEAFCLLNDQAIAAAHLLDHKLAKRILIIDLDVHQGNGTAHIFKSNRSVFTFSVHGASNYPFKKEESDLDIALEKGTTDDDYLSVLDQHMYRIVESFKPDFIFYLCGVDVLGSDKLGTLNLSLQGSKARDERVLNLAKEKNIPVVCCMGGGYSKDIKIIVEAHANTFRAAQDLFF